MKKRWFDKKQYLETMNQLKLPGILFTLFFAAMILYIPLRSYMGVQESIRVGTKTMNQFPMIVNYISEHSGLVLTFMFYTPTLTLMCWNFLTKRNASDFYDSLPYKRSCTFLTHVSAIVTYQVITLVLCGVVSAIVYGILSDYFIIDYGTMCQMYVVLFAANLLCMSAITLACMLTGTIFANICVSGMILFIPRLLMYGVNAMVNASIVIMTDGNLLPIFDKKLNIITSICLQMFDVGASISVSEKLLNVKGMAYTFGLAVIYGIIAFVLYQKRKSEAAGLAAVNRRVQACIRGVLGFVIAFIGLFSIMLSWVTGTDIRIGDIVSELVVLVIAAMVMLVYESMATKRVHGILKCIPSIFVVYAVSVVAVFGMYGVVRNIFSYQPAANQVDAVQINISNNQYWSYSGAEDYFQEMNRKIKIDDEQIKDILCTALQETITAYESNRSEEAFYEYRRKNQLYAYEVVFYDGHFAKNRTVYLTEKQMNEVAQRLQYANSYKEAMTDLPALQEADVSVEGAVEFTKEEIKDLYKLLLEDIQGIPFAQWYSLVTKQNRNENEITIRFTRDGHLYQANVPISVILPQTSAKYAQMCNEKAIQSGTKQAVLEKLQNSETTKKNLESNERLHIFIMDKTGTIWINDAFDTYMKDCGTQADEILASMIQQVSAVDSLEVRTQEGVVALRYYNYEYNEKGEGKDTSGIVYIPLLPEYMTADTTY